MRVLMPQFEKQSLEAGQPVDRLEPPQDPRRPRMPSSRSLWEENPSRSPLLGGLGGGGSNSILNSSSSSIGGNSSGSSGTESSAWDAPGFRKELPSGSSSTSSDSSSSGSGASSWKFW